MRGSGDGSGGASGSGGAEGGKVTERGEELLAVGAGAGAEQAVYAPEVVRREEKGARERRAQERRSRARVEVV